jgi:hypothetical protein
MLAVVFVDREVVVVVTREVVEPMTVAEPCVPGNFIWLARFGSYNHYPGRPGLAVPSLHIPEMPWLTVEQDLQVAKLGELRSGDDLRGIAAQERAAQAGVRIPAWRVRWGTCTITSVLRS